MTLRFKYFSTQTLSGAVRRITSGCSARAPVSTGVNNIENIVSKILTLDFLILVIITSVILNILSSYLKSLLDKGIAKLNSSYHEKLILLKEEDKFNNILFESEEFRNIHRDEAIFERIRSTWFLVFALFAFILVAIVHFSNQDLIPGLDTYATIFGFICLMLSMKYVLSSTKKWNRAFNASNANKTL